MKHTRPCSFALVVLGASVVVANSQAKDDLDAQAQAIVDRMSIDELIGQMTQINIDAVIDWDSGDNKAVDPSKIREMVNHNVGSYLNTPFSAFSNNDRANMERVAVEAINNGGKIAWTVSEWRSVIKQLQDTHMKQNSVPIIYGLDTIHGANYVAGAVAFPHQINIGMTFDPKFATSLGKFAGRDTKAAGVNWVFGPCLEVSRHKGWPRTHETFGEDPVVVAEMGKHIVQGIQSNNVAACFKHFIGYSGSADGKDRGDVTLSKYDLLNHFVPSFKAAIDAGIMTGMGSYVNVNGTPMSANRQLHMDLLRKDLQFDGMHVSDWSEIYMMDWWHHFALNQKDAVKRAMNNASYDMSMVPDDTSFIDHMKTLYASKEVPFTRIKNSAKRVIKLKLKLNLYKDPVPGADVADQVGDWPSQAAAWDAAQESLVLLKNDNSILPLDKSKKFFFTGSSIDNIGLLCGGWTVTWQGVKKNEYFPDYRRTIKDAMSAVVNDPSRTTFYEGVNIGGTWQDINQAKAMAQEADYTVVAIGERTYAELMGNKDPFELPSGLTDYVKELASTGTKIILILAEGRPRLLNGVADVASAIVYAGLPCEMGGEAISEVLFGKENFSGKMALTYPKTDDDLNMATPYYGRRGDMCVVDGVESSCPVEWQFGEGLSYTTFDYS
ncbi:hypothetical protein As57867_019081, partial [Aphanomyces stellatus]